MAHPPAFEPFPPVAPLREQWASAELPPPPPGNHWMTQPPKVKVRAASSKQGGAGYRLCPLWGDGDGNSLSPPVSGRGTLCHQKTELLSSLLLVGFRSGYIQCALSWQFAAFIQSKFTSCPQRQRKVTLSAKELNRMERLPSARRSAVDS